MDTLLIIALVSLALAVLAGGGYFLYQRRKTRRAQPEPEPLGYTSGGANYMITMGIGTPAEISAFILLGLAANPSAITPSAGRMHRHPYIGMRLHL